MDSSLRSGVKSDWLIAYFTCDQYSKRTVYKSVEWMVGTVILVRFIMSLITAQRWAGLCAVKLSGKLFHVWTLCSGAALSMCLFTLLLKSYLCDKKKLNTAADKDEMHGRCYFLLSVSNWEPPIFRVNGLKKDRDGQKWDDQCCMIWVLITQLFFFMAVCTMEICQNGWNNL